MHAVFPKRARPAISAEGFRPDALDQAFGIRWGLESTQKGLRILPSLEFNRDCDFAEGRPETA